MQLSAESRRRLLTAAIAHASDATLFIRHLRHDLLRHFHIVYYATRPAIDFATLYCRAAAASQPAPSDAAIFAILAAEGWLIFAASQAFATYATSRTSRQLIFSAAALADWPAR